MSPRARLALLIALLVCVGELFARGADADSNVRLKITKSGWGDGTVYAYSVGIQCGDICEASVPPESQITLTTWVPPGMKFIGWSNGGCQGTGTCVVTMATAMTVTAKFDDADPVHVTVATSGEGTGRVTSSEFHVKSEDDDGTPVLRSFDCGDECELDPFEGTEITLTAKPDIGSTLLGWSEDRCNRTVVNSWGQEPSLSTTCEIKLKDDSMEVTAEFGPSETTTLSVSKEGEGTVTTDDVAGDGDGGVSKIDCGDTCESQPYRKTKLTLNAKEDEGSKFVGWSGGACKGTKPTCQITMDSDKSVSAEFAKLEPKDLEVEKTGSGKGTVTSEVTTTDANGQTTTGTADETSKIDCGETCSANPVERTKIVLTAKAEAGSKFLGWTGAGCTGLQPCHLTIDDDKDVKARFDEVALATLNVTKIGTGKGEVKSEHKGVDDGSGGKNLVAETESGGGELKCGVEEGDCSITPYAGTVVNMTAEPAAEMKFVGWTGGGCPTTGPLCSVTLKGDTEVRAKFDELTTADIDLEMSGDGKGVVTSKNTKISNGGVAKSDGSDQVEVADGEGGKDLNCSSDETKGTDCQTKNYVGSTITLTADPDEGMKFVGWTGVICSTSVATPAAPPPPPPPQDPDADDEPPPPPPPKPSGPKKGTCVVKLDRQRIMEVSARFEPLVPQELTVEKPEGGTVTSCHLGVYTGVANPDATTADSTEQKAADATIAAAPKWPPDCPAPDPKEVELRERETTEGGEIDCSDSHDGLCKIEPYGGSVMSLYAKPRTGMKFVRWSGACSGSEPSCKVTMTSAKEVVAQFAEIPVVEVNVLLEGGKGGVTQVKEKTKGVKNGIADQLALIGEKADATADDALAGSDAATKSHDDLSCLGGTSDICQTHVFAGTAIRLVATPAKKTAASGSSEGNPDMKFVRWVGGGCSGTNNICDVVVARDADVTAEFAPLVPATITVVVEADTGVTGSVDGVVAGISDGTVGTGDETDAAAPESVGDLTFTCKEDNGRDCVQEPYVGSSVSLTAKPGDGFRFVGWSGAGPSCAPATSKTPAKPGGASGGASAPAASKTAAPKPPVTCVVTVKDAITVTAKFDKPPPVDFTVVLDGDGIKGTVTGVLVGVSDQATEALLGSEDFECKHTDVTCVKQPYVGSEVTLTAAPGLGTKFVGWSGASCGGGTAAKTPTGGASSNKSKAECKLSVKDAMEVHATFEKFATVKLEIQHKDGGATMSKLEGVDDGTGQKRYFDPNGNDDTSPPSLLPECTPTDCLPVVQYVGAKLTLTAKPIGKDDPDGKPTKFTGWEGVCNSTNKECVVNFTEDLDALTAKFEPLEPMQLKVTIEGDSASAGKVDSKLNTGTGASTGIDSKKVAIDGDIACPGTCSIQPYAGSVYTLTAGFAQTNEPPISGGFASKFTGWSGTVRGSGKTIQVTINDSTADVIATFEKVPVHLVRVTARNGSLTVSSSGAADDGLGGRLPLPSSQSCGDGEPCQIYVYPGTRLTINARAGPVSDPNTKRMVVKDWTGDCNSGNSTSCSLDNITEYKEATVTFEEEDK